MSKWGSITDAIKAQAKKLRARDPKYWTWERIGLELNVTAAGIYYAINPRRKSRRNDRRRLAADQLAASQSRRNGGVGPVSHVKSNDQEARRQRARALPDTRDLTAQFFGDPLPGRSALDQKRARDGL